MQTSTRLRRTHALALAGTVALGSLLLGTGPAQGAKPQSTSTSTSVSKYAAEGAQVPTTYIPPAKALKRASGLTPENKFASRVRIDGVNYVSVSYSGPLLGKAPRGRVPDSISIGIISGPDLGTILAQHRTVGWQLTARADNAIVAVLNGEEAGKSTGYVTVMIPRNGYLATGGCTYYQRSTLPTLAGMTGCAERIAQLVAARPI